MLLNKSPIIYDTRRTIFGLYFPSTDQATAPGQYKQFYLNVKTLTEHVPNPKQFWGRYNFCSPIDDLFFLQLYHKGAIFKWSFFLYLSNLLRSAPWILKSILVLFLLLSSSLLMPMRLISLGDPTHASSASSSINIFLSFLLSPRMPGVLFSLTVGKWVHPYAVITTKLAPDLGVQGHL